MCPILICEPFKVWFNLDLVLLNTPQGQKLLWWGPSVQRAQVLPRGAIFAGTEAHQLENGCAQKLQHARMSPPRPRMSATSGAPKHARKVSPSGLQSLRIGSKSSWDWWVLHAAWMSSQNPGCMITATNKGTLKSSRIGNRSEWWQGDHLPMSCPTRMADTLLRLRAAVLS